MLKLLKNFFSWLTKEETEFEDLKRNYCEYSRSWNPYSTKGYDRRNW